MAHAFKRLLTLLGLCAMLMTLAWPAPAAQAEIAEDDLLIGSVVSGSSTFALMQSASGDITWAEARRRAVALGGHLAVITSEEDSEAIGKLGRRDQCDAWMGAYFRETEWKWVTGEAFDYTAWQDDYWAPNGFKNGSVCAYIYISYAQRLSSWGNTLETRELSYYLVEYNDGAVDPLSPDTLPLAPNASSYTARPISLTDGVYEEEFEVLFERAFWTFSPEEDGVYAFRLEINGGCYEDTYSFLEVSVSFPEGGGYRISCNSSEDVNLCYAQMYAGCTYSICVSTRDSQTVCGYWMQVSRVAEAVDGASMETAKAIALTNGPYTDEVFVRPVDNKFYWTFKPEEDGLYTFVGTPHVDREDGWAQLQYSYCEGEVSDPARADWDWIDNGSGCGLNVPIPMQAGNTYLLSLNGFAASGYRFSIAFSRTGSVPANTTYDKARPITLVNDAFNEEFLLLKSIRRLYWSFTPEEDGEYLFYTFWDSSAPCSDSTDNYAILYEQNGSRYTKLTEVDDGAENRCFLLRYTLTAGKTYYLSIEMDTLPSTCGYSLEARYLRPGQSAAKNDRVIARKTFGGRTYLMMCSDSAISWLEARQRAVALGGHLATVTSAQEAEIVSSLGENERPLAWLGGYLRIDQWKWVTGEPFEYYDWNPNEPDIRPGFGVYLSMRWQWNDPHCGWGDEGSGESMFKYVVELGSGHSDPDPTDPANNPVMARDGVTPIHLTNDRYEGTVYHPGRSVEKTAFLVVPDRDGVYAVEFTVTDSRYAQVSCNGFANHIDRHDRSYRVANEWEQSNFTLYVPMHANESYTIELTGDECEYRMRVYPAGELSNGCEEDARFISLTSERYTENAIYRSIDRDLWWKFTSDVDATYLVALIDARQTNGKKLPINAYSLRFYDEYNPWGQIKDTLKSFGGWGGPNQFVHKMDMEAGVTYGLQVSPQLWNVDGNFQLVFQRISNPSHNTHVGVETPIELANGLYFEDFLFTSEERWLWWTFVPPKTGYYTFDLSPLASDLNNDTKITYRILQFRGDDKDDLTLSSSNNKVIKNGKVHVRLKLTGGVTHRFLLEHPENNDIDCSICFYRLMVEQDGASHDLSFLPQSLFAIEEEAFAGVAMSSVVIPDNCRRIESRAFAGCEGLRLVYLTGSLEFIAADAFPEGASFVAPSGSYAAEWAESNGYSCLLRN